ncbi:hypothetical protein [Polluticoccus soli]|uniref:hypothetical protein n=1 Tax=Polluticoccus soli TaxID=3034150 RepID=UPI0023E22881|nr:hypothetical protein [Flavipsychrobacter sp. JY13-12]
MQQSSRYIISIGAGIGCISIIYFLMLIVHMPFIVTALATAAALFFLCRWICATPFTEQEHFSKMSTYVLIAGAFIFVNEALDIAQKHGVWDAWAIWNLNAKYLANPDHWQNMLLNTKFSHPDYPLALPATVAFFSRLLGQFNHLVPFAVALLITLCIPMLVFTELRKNSLLVAGITLLLFVTNEFYLMQGTYQLADTLLAFYFLCSLVCINHHQEDKRMLVLTGAFLGLSIWTKNEGVILAGIFILFHWRELLGRYRIKYTLTGIAVPIITWAVFKGLYAPPNDLVQQHNSKVYGYLVDPKRYQIVWNYFADNLKHFTVLKWAVVIYLAFCAWRRTAPDKQVLMILACMGVYLMVYVVTTNDLEWHLFTSQSRLMHQLMPALMYLLARKLAGSNRATTNFRARFFSAQQHPQSPVSRWE